jgi:DNA replication protein DnaC
VTDDLDQLLRSLRLHKMAEILDDQLRAAEKEGATYEQLLARLLRAQWHARQEKALDYRIKTACLPELWTLETFPFDQQPEISRRQINTFAELDFIPRAENIVFIGSAGVGKTGLASALLLKALQNGYRGRFIRAQDLFDEMYASLADRSTRKLVDKLARLDLLLIDELGYLTIRPEQANAFFKLMQERYRRKATIITTNLDFSEWHNFLGNKALVEALLSRLRHQCHTVTIDGPSLRDSQS